MFDEFERRRKYYGRMKMNIALARTNDSATDPLKLRFGRISFTEATENADARDVQDYGDLLLAEVRTDPTEFRSLMNGMLGEATLKVGGISFPAALQLTHSYDNFNPSRRAWGYVVFDWPYQYYELRDNTNFGWVNGPFLKPGLSPHIDMQDALASYFEGNVYNLPDRRVEVVLPDYRARLKRIQVDGRILTVDVERRADVDNLILQVATMNASGTRSFSKDIALDSEQVRYEAPDSISQFRTYIIDKKGERVDLRDVNLSYPQFPEGVSIMNETENLEEIIKRGETDTIEFKEQYEKDLVLRTVVAFANTKGGAILLGVNKYAEVKGVNVKFESVTDSLTNAISQGCDPSIQWTLTKTQIRDVEIHVLRIPEGTDKPYMLADQGVYVRRTGTTRRITRRELDEIYQRRTANAVPTGLLR